jgi:hypothetical protein
MEFDSPPMSGVDWDRMAAVVAVEDRLGGGEGYDMLQAAEALPAGLTASPSNVEMDRRGNGAKIALSGPHVLSWSATSDVSWIEVMPASGDLPATVTVASDPGSGPLPGAEGTVTFSAAGDGMDFTKTVTVTVGAAGHRWRPLRVAPSSGPKRR